MKTANVSDAKLRSQLFRTMLKVNMGITPFDPVDLKYIKPNDLANKINKNTGMNVKSINFDKDTYLYSIKLNDDYSIISDCGYILKSEDVTNIFGSGEELSINSLVSNYAKTMNINYIYKHFLNKNNKLTDETNYNYFDSFFIVINNDDYNDNNINELRVKFDKLLSFFKKVATNNINLPMDNYNVAKTIQTINSVHNNNVNFKSFEVSKHLQSVFNLDDDCYKNNNFTVKLEFSKDMVGFDNHIMKSIKLGVERVPNEIIKENSVDDLTSKNRAVVVIRDHGSVINAISKKMNVDSMDTRMGIANTIEKSSKGRVRIKSKNHPINTAIPRWNNMFAFDDSELVILGTMDEVVRLLSIFERLIFDVLTYTYDMDQIANTKGIRDKIDILLKSDISAYEISKNFDIAGNKITQLRRGTTHLDRLSFGNAEKLTRAFDFYAQKGLLGKKDDDIKQKFIKSNFGLSKQQMEKVTSYIKDNQSSIQSNVVITGCTASGKKVLIDNIKNNLKMPELVCFYRTKEIADKGTDTNGRLWLGEVMSGKIENFDVKKHLYRQVLIDSGDKNKALKLINSIGMEIHLNKKNDNGKTVRFIDYINVYDADGKHAFKY